MGKRLFWELHMTAYRLVDGNGDWFLDGPMTTLQYVLRLHPDAMRRIRAETKDGGTCILHSNGKPNWHSPRFLVSVVGEE